jgi:hypothetical protein
MLIIRGTQSDVPAGTPAAMDAAPEADPLYARAMEEFAEDLAAGRTPTIRARL